MTDNIRQPAVAGAFYPRNPRQLRDAITSTMNQATPPALAGKVRALIVPHAGYVYSAPVAAYGYKLLQLKQLTPKRILLMGPAHRVWFPGTVFPTVTAFATPLGDQPVDAEAARAWANQSDVIGLADSPHRAEHCLEVQYPFLHLLYPDVPTLPLLCGDVAPEAVAQAILMCQQSEGQTDDLIIVSSDLSHYMSNTAAHETDGRLLDALLASEPEGVAHGEACGKTPILALMAIAKLRNWQPHLLDYRTSGDVMGDKSQVVGYAAVAFMEE